MYAKLRWLLKVYSGLSPLPTYNFVYHIISQAAVELRMRRPFCRCVVASNGRPRRRDGKMAAAFSAWTVNTNQDHAHPSAGAGCLVFAEDARSLTAPMYNAALQSDDS